MIRSLCAGGAYFSGVFALGFALGIVRVLITAPAVGEFAAVLLEIPIILTASWFTARWCVAQFSVPPDGAERLTMGFVAFSLTMLAELALSVILFGHTVSEHVATYTHLLGFVGLAAQLLFALIPYVQCEPRWCPPRP
jgi:hypothetical protein